MIRLISILLLLALGAQAQVTLTWYPSPNATGYAIVDWRNGGVDTWFTGSTTNFTTPGPLAYGGHRFGLCGFRTDGSNFVFSAWANQVQVMNTPAVALDYITLTSTNLSGWQIVATNSMTFTPDNFAQYFQMAWRARKTNNVAIAPPTP